MKKLPLSSLWIVTLLMGVAGRELLSQRSPRTVFEVASIRRIEPPYRALRTLKISGTLVTLEGYSISLLVLEAFGLKDYQLRTDSVPRAAQEVYYDIEARSPGESAPTKAEVRSMIQALLAERFHLVIHREVRNMPVYALVVDKNGPKLKPGSGDDECHTLIGPVRPEDRNYRYRFTNCTLDGLVDTMSADRAILDKTGLTGRYDIEIFATPEFRMHDTSEVGDVRFLDAVRKLGLRLSAQNAPIEVVVIDHVDSAPSAN